jgi:hypothetical protein
MLDQFLMEVKRLPRPHPILAGFVIAYMAALLFAYREVIEWYWLPRWGDPQGYYSYAYLVPPTGNRDDLDAAGAAAATAGTTLVVGHPAPVVGHCAPPAGPLGLVQLALQHGVPAVF